MSQASQDYASSAWDQIKASLGVSASYTPPSASATTLTGKTIIVKETGTVQMLGQNGADMSIRTATVRCDPGDIPQPLPGGRFTIGSAHSTGYDYWTIIGQPIKRFGIWSCPCRFSRELRVGERGGAGGQANG